MATRIQMTPTKTKVEHLRRQLVSRERFLQLLVSRRSLVRLDDRSNCLRGLLDSSGSWFVIDELELTEPEPIDGPQAK